MDSFITIAWPFVRKPQVLIHDEGYFILRFDTVEQREKVMEAGSYYFHKKPFVLQNWELNFEFDPDCLTTILLWVTFPGLLVGYWSTDVLSKVASAIGRPLYIDKFTASMDRSSFARILVEADVAQPLPDIIELLTPAGSFTQQLNYDWKPKYCTECLKFGHIAANCWNAADEGPRLQEFHEVKKKRRMRNRKRQSHPEQGWKANEVVEQQADEIINVVVENPAPPQNLAPPATQEAINSPRNAPDPVASQEATVQNAQYKSVVPTANSYEVLQAYADGHAGEQRVDKNPP
ncbi:uncharacterized protein LOC132601689 [Lycium barbarum]|uniref:uncharacterized protein LOC132601689 n=1 Tax=Lycium barbarum TaxID=112863 RepID=UPI00293F1AC0|nr:uncharacterized protein LOC132601689 [Lycium barbarum]